MTDSSIPFVIVVDKLSATVVFPSSGRQLVMSMERRDLVILWVRTALLSFRNCSDKAESGLARKSPTETRFILS